MPKLSRWRCMVGAEPSERLNTASCVSYCLGGVVAQGPPMALLATSGGSARPGVRVAKREAGSVVSCGGGQAIRVGPWVSITAACVSNCQWGWVVHGVPMQLTASGGSACQGGWVAKAVHLELHCED